MVLTKCELSGYLCFLPTCFDSMQIYSMRSGLKLPRSKVQYFADSTLIFHYRYKLGFRRLVPFKIFIFYEIARSDFGISDFGLNSHTKKTLYAN